MTLSRRMNLVQMIFLGQEDAQIKGLLAEGADPDDTDEDGSPVITIATGLGADSVVELLLKAGAHVDAVDGDGETALHRAASISNLKAIELLVRAGANVNARTNTGKTPLILASTMGYADACRALHLAGADVCIVDDSGRSALHWAVLRNDNADLAELLMAIGADAKRPDFSGQTASDLARITGRTFVLDGSKGSGIAVK